MGNDCKIYLNSQEALIEISTEEKEKKQVIFVDFLENNKKQKIYIKGEYNSQIDFYYFIFNTQKQIDLEIFLEHYHSSQINCFVKTFNANSSYTKVKIFANVKDQVNKCISNQVIDGFLFDESSNINVTPSLLIANNEVNAMHSVNIGMIDPHKVFYLMSKGVNKQESINLILNSHFKVFEQCSSTEAKEILLKIKEIIKRLAYE